jgi:hypothetical protein
MIVLDYSLQKCQKTMQKYKNLEKISVHKMFFVFSRFVIFFIVVQGFLGPGPVNILIFLFERARRDAEHHRVLF